MGWLIEKANVSVALVGLSEEVAEILRQRLLMVGQNDPGTCNVHKARNFNECRALLDPQDITAVCIHLAEFQAAECVSFIADIRTTHPLIGFVLIGTSEYLEELPNFHEKWKERFEHYYKLKIDSGDEDFDANAGALRDLLIADVIKSKALGQYQTTPGKLIRLKAAAPYGFKITVIVALLAAILGGSIGPIFDRLFPSSEDQAKEAADAIQDTDQYNATQNGSSTENPY